MIFRVLGQLEVRDSGTSVAYGGPKQQKILAALLLAYGQTVSVRRLVDTVWETDPPATAEKQVRNAISDLRQILPENAPHVELVTGGYRLNAGDHLDAIVFTRMLEHARLLVTDRPLDAVSEFRAALTLWRGDALTGLECPGLAPQVAKLQEQRLTAIEECIDLELRQGNHRSVVSELSEWARENPLRERITALLMLALHRMGAPAEAARAYQRIQVLLKEELDVEPNPDLRNLNQRIQANDKTLAAPGTWLPRCDLPRDTSSFTGRAAELAKLTELAGEDSTMVISVVDGMAGAGKTALAVHAAHRLAGRFPDAQLFIDLHAHTPGETPLTPASALEKLLCALGVDEGRIPHDLDDRAALWRAQLAGRRALIVLDNVTDTRQIEPLLPGAPGCLTLVTTRHRLVDLDAIPVAVDVLPPADARLLFLEVVGDNRPLAEPDSTVEVLKLCGYLPLAVRIAGSKLRHRPSWAVSHLASRLRDQRRRIDELHTDDHSVAAAFTLSYEQLPPDRRLLFRLLGHAPGDDIDSHAAAALIEQSPDKAETMLENLVDAHLLQQSVPGRYLLHDLLRSYGAQLSLGTDVLTKRNAAITRLLDYYLDTAALAMNVLAPTERAHRPAMSDARSTTADVSGYSRALAWLGTERLNLLAAARFGTERGWLSHAFKLSGTLWRYFHISGYHNDALTLHMKGLAAARAAGNTRFEADALASLGYVNWWLGRYKQALNDCSAAVQLANNVGDRSLEGRALHALGLVHTRLGADEEAQAALQDTLAAGTDTGDRILEGYALRGLGEVYYRLSRLDDAVSSYEEAAAVGRDMGNITIEGYAVRALGELYSNSGQNDKALTYCLRALELARTGRNRNIENRALRTLAEIHRRIGRYDRAFERYEEALRVAGETGNPYEAACAHDGVAQTCINEDNVTGALEHWTQALTLFEELDVPERHQVRNSLATLNQQRS